MMLSSLLLAAAAPAVLGLPTMAPSNATTVPGKYIVILKPEVKTPIFDDHMAWVTEVHARRLGKRETDTAGVEKTWTDTDSFKGYSGEFDEDTLDEIMHSDEVVSVEPVQVIELYETVTQTNTPWGLGSISHRDPGFDTYTYDASAGQGTWAYVIDTGLYTGHADFQGRASLGYNAVKGSTFVDSQGHGTHCAGTIASKTYGVAKKANVVSVKVFGTGASSTDVVLDGYLWAVSNITSTPGRREKSVISMSLGGGKSNAINGAVEAAYQQGVLTVVAAGNSQAPALDFSPASSPNAVTVGAIDRRNVKPDFSNYGASVDLFAAGVDVLSTWIGSGNRVARLSGTSMATPHVAGLALYLMAKENLTSPAAVAARIRELATVGKVTSAGEGSPNLLAFHGQ